MLRRDMASEAKIAGFKSSVNEITGKRRTAITKSAITTREQEVFLPGRAQKIASPTQTPSVLTSTHARFSSNSIGSEGRTLFFSFYCAARMGYIAPLRYFSSGRG